VTVTQDPFLLPEASLRFNLDPSASVGDDQLRLALDRVGLWSHFARYETSAVPSLVANGVRPTEGGNASAMLSGDNDGVVLGQRLSTLPVLSGGQAQLLAIARAVVQTRKMSQEDPVGSKPIVLLDEVTSSLERRAEELVCDIIEQEFAANGHTVLVVTHKLGALGRRLRGGRDVVVWMANGKIEEVETVGRVDVSED
jgi:ATP-binding cassette subfamily C (CFTR/MRP) protein 1